MKTLIVFLVIAVGYAVRLVRQRRLTRDADYIDQEIKRRGYRYREGFEMMDEELRKRTEARRKIADNVKRDGRLLETKDDRASRIHLAGGR